MVDSSIRPLRVTGVTIGRWPKFELTRKSEKSIGRVRWLLPGIGCVANVASESLYFCSAERITGSVGDTGNRQFAVDEEGAVAAPSVDRIINQPRSHIETVVLRINLGSPIRFDSYHVVDFAGTNENRDAERRHACVDLRIP